MDRRAFLRLSVAGSVGAATFGVGFWEALYAAPAAPGEGLYGNIDGKQPDENGLILPDGFTSRVIGRAGVAVVGTSTVWHPSPDGGCTFPLKGGRWVYVSNSEEDDGGGVTAVRFDVDGTIMRADRICEGTRRNCAGGPTPWGTWLSCEEFDSLDVGGSSAGRVWECDPSGQRPARVRPAMGSFAHEAAAVDPHNQCVYLSEDQPDGRFYRFTPTIWPDLANGRLEVAYESASGRVAWLGVPDPEAKDGVPTRRQVELSSAYDGGEGLWFDSGDVYFATKGDNRVRRFDTARQRMEVIYDAARWPEAPLTGVDNVTVSSLGDVFVAEDGGNLELVMISRERVVAPFLRMVDAPGSELAGPAFSPDGTRLYVSSMRNGPEQKGTTYEISGPFRGGGGRGGVRSALEGSGNGGLSGRDVGALGVTAAAAAGAATLIMRNRIGRGRDTEA